MPFKYIGRKHDFKGKSLWEIIGNLKNYGVGRLVTRSVYDRYPEVTFIKILNVEPLPNPIKPSMDDMRKVRITVERTFRGKTFSQPEIMEHTTYKTDFRLVPKDEEESIYKRLNVKAPEKVKIFPKYMDFPPLLKETLIRDAKEKGQNPNSLKLEIVYNKSLLSKHKIAEDGETPTEQIAIGLGKTQYADTLYKGVKLN